MRYTLILGLLWCSMSVALGQPAPGNGFGRFGRVNDDGLLTLNVSPTGFVTPPFAPPLRVQFGDGTGQASVTSLNPTEKVLQLTGGGEGAPSQVRYKVVHINTRDLE